MPRINSIFIWRCYFVLDIEPSEGETCRAGDESSYDEIAEDPEVCKDFECQEKRWSNGCLTIKSCYTNIYFLAYFSVEGGYCVKHNVLSNFGDFDL